MINRSDAFTNSCRHCKPPKCHVGCRADCKEYHDDLKVFEQYKLKEREEIVKNQITYNKSIRNKNSFD